MTQLFLNRSEIRTRPQEVRRATVAECVGVQIGNTVDGPRFPHNSPCGSVAQSFVEPIEEQRAFRRELLKPNGEGFRGGRAKRYDPFLLALAEHPDQSVSQIKVDDVEAYGLRDPKSCSIDQLQECSISISEPPLLAGVLDHCGGLLNIEKTGRLFWNPGTLKSYGRTDCDKLLAKHPSIKTSNGGNFSSHSRRRQVSLSTLGADPFL